MDSECAALNCIPVIYGGAVLDKGLNIADGAVKPHFPHSSQFKLSSLLSP